MKIQLELEPIALHLYC